MQPAAPIHKLRTDLHEQVYATTCEKVRNRGVDHEQRLFTDDLSLTRHWALGKFSMKRMSSSPRMGSIGRRPLPVACTIGALLLLTSVVALFGVRALAGRRSCSTRRHPEWRTTRNFQPGRLVSPISISLTSQPVRHRTCRRRNLDGQETTDRPER